METPAPNAQNKPEGGACDRESFAAVFRVAPPGTALYLEQSATWCTAVAHAAGRKVRTRKTYSISHKGVAAALTRVEFVGEARQRKLPHSIDDPRQLSLPVVLEAA